jgi:membrane-bound lytic murein transglycosylase B
MDIPDFDDGNFDGTAEYDRAVGPMQIIPATWAAWHVDGNLDGSEDGQQIDDSTLAAAGYLCFSGGDLATAAGWDAAITAYNQAPQYIIDIAAKADEYAAAVR